MTSRIILKLSVESDLTEAALYEAQGLIREHNIENKKFESFKYQVLRIASQNMGVAPFLGQHINAMLELSPTYKPDEWSLTEVSYRDREQHKIVVHSEGV